MRNGLRRFRKQRRRTTGKQRPNHNFPESKASCVAIATGHLRSPYSARSCLTSLHGKHLLRSDISFGKASFSLLDAKVESGAPRPGRPAPQSRQNSKDFCSVQMAFKPTLVFGAPGKGPRDLTSVQMQARPPAFGRFSGVSKRSSASTWKPRHSFALSARTSLNSRRLLTSSW